MTNNPTTNINLSDKHGDRLDMGGGWSLVKAHGLSLRWVWYLEAPGANGGITVLTEESADMLRSLLARALEAGTAAQRASGCPCLIVEPCSGNCSCAHPGLSGGCLRCARYGNGSHRKAVAQRLAGQAKRIQELEDRVAPDAVTMTSEQYNELLTEAATSYEENLYLKEVRAELEAAVAKWQAKFEEMLDAEHALSDAYLRLRVILGAVEDAPNGLPAEELWAYTEAKATALAQHRTEEVNKVGRMMADAIKQANDARNELGFAQAIQGEERGRWYGERMDLQIARTALEAKNAKLTAALRLVEFSNIGMRMGGIVNTCVACTAVEGHHHASECPIGLALADAAPSPEPEAKEEAQK